MTPTHNYIETNGQALYVKQWGVRGQAVVLLHHMTASSDDWDVIAPLLAARFRVFAVDLRGRGFSSKPAHGYRWVEDLAEDIIQLLPQLSDSPSVLIGHSLGGMIAVPVAAKAPEQVAALVLEDPPLADQEPWYTGDMWRENARYQQMSLSEKIEHRLGQGHAPHEALPRAEADHRMSPQLLLEYIAGTSSYDFRVWLPRVGCPSLLMLGEHGVLSQDNRRKLFETYSFSAVSQWKGCGHGLHEFNPERFVAEVEAFVRREQEPEL